MIHIKLAILYHSESGNTRKVAELIAEGVKKVDDVEVKCLDINNPDNDFIDESDCVIFGTPTYVGNFSWQMKKYLDVNCKCKLADKLGAVYATENFIGGGADFALVTLIGHLLVKGMVVYSGGAAVGNPYTHFGAVCIKDGTEDQKERAVIFGKRVAIKAKELFVK